jgi:hypothetical protein
LETLKRLWPGITAETGSIARQARQSADSTRDRARQLLAPDTTSEPSLSPQAQSAEATDLIPRRRYRGPGLAIGSLARLPPTDQAAWQKLIHERQGAYTLPVLAEYWADGRRTIGEIVHLIEMEIGIRDPELVAGLFEMLHKLGLISYVSPETEAAS